MATQAASKSLLTVLLLAASLIAFISCEKDFDSSVVMCYTSIPLEIMTDLKKDFESKNAKASPINVDMKIYREGSGHVIAKLTAEKETGGIKADVLWIAEPSYYYQLKQMGILMPYESKWAEDVPAIFKDEDKMFYGARLFMMSVVYNTAQVKDPPKTWKDLLDPKWAGKVVIANPAYSGATHIFIGAMVQKYGWDYFKTLNQNGLVVVKGNNAVTSKVATGEFAIGIAIHNMILDLKNQGSPVDIIYPSDGNVVITSPIAIFKDSKNVKLSQVFVDYMLSKEGQEILVQKGNFIPIRSDVAYPPNTPPREQLMANAIDMEWMKNAAYVEELKEEFLRLVVFQ